MLLLVIAAVHGVPAEAQASPNLVGALSRKVHGAAGTFDLPLALTPANPTTEPRAGPAQTVVFVFEKQVIAGTVVVTEGAAVTGAPTFSGSEMIVALTGVTNMQYVTVAVTSVVAADGGTGGSGSVRLGYLAGDVSQNRAVTLSDLGQVNAQVAQFVTGANFTKDVNASGTLSLADKGVTNTQVTKVLPAVPMPANEPPHVNAGTNQAVTLPASAALTGSGSDDNLPGSPLTFAWTKVSGPGMVSFGTPNSAATAATLSTAGVYVLRLTTSDGVLSNADDVTITVNEPTELAPDPVEVTPRDVTTANNRPPIRALFADVGVGIDAASVRLLVDGIDVTAHATIDAASVSYTPTNPLGDGAHTASVTIADVAGNSVSRTWTFSVMAATPPFGSNAGTRGTLRTPVIVTPTH